MTNNGCSSVVSNEITVTVEDKVAPTVVTQPLTVQLDASGAATITAAQINNGSSDNCEIASLSLDVTSFDCSNVGPNTVTLTVTDVNGNSSTGTAVVTVEDKVAPTVVTQPLTVQLDASGAATITAAQINNGSSDNCEIASLSLDVTSFDCSNVGPNTVTLTVTDVNGNSSTGTAVVTVEDKIKPTIIVPNAISISNDDKLCGALMIITAPIASDNCSVRTPVGIRSDGKYLTDVFPVGTTTITWTVSDANGNSAAAVEQTVTVTNSSPVIGSITASTDKPINIEFGTVTLTVNFADNNVTKAAVNWGDGVIEMVDVNGTSVDLTHKYSKANIYAPVITITDACGEVSSSIEYQYVVIYDPNGGFVTGGGWINSPLEPTVEYMQVGGKANFGFNAKYKTGKNELDQVDGNTTFHLNAGNLNFKSSSHTKMSLVIAKHKATYTGEGTINGSGAYEFRVIAVDGDLKGNIEPDQFRIKIWRKGYPSDVVYDNQLGIAENVDPSGDNTILGGGSIVIHENKSIAGSGNTKKLETADQLEGLSSARFDNYPNAFSDRTTIRFSFDKEEQFALEVYDVRGSLIKKVATGNADAGQVYEYELDARHLAEGVYFARLITGTNAQTVKMILKK
ncbi:putative secreted protein (Por secretion system target) [Pontibacter virosus]|uniref:Putative secreted protein (Por secretion system target) n=1 Tax=Pontibacter virosus TaxID=1765052 RepID=A0A2U1AWJ1_9BACT|nr:putative secreted protein (Por secretion system target) [Pontibacter virosus]